MKQRIIVLLLLLQALMMSACAITVIPYEPTAHLTREEARSMLIQTFEEQPRRRRPVVVEIGDDAIRLGFSTVKSSAQGGLTTIERRQTYYFSNLADLQLILHKGRYLIKLSNREGSVWRWVRFYSEKQGTDFLDAMSRMTRPD